MNTMRYSVLAASVLALGLGLATSAPRAEGTPQPASKEGRLRTISMTVGSKDIRAAVADTMPSRQEGLLGWKSITDSEGMLLDFVFPDKLAIHMQGMKFPIDAVWIDTHGVIQVIYENIAPNSGQIYPSMIACRYCLELKAGFCKKYDVKIGQKVRFNAR
jgi:uncharacterized protein